MQLVTWAISQFLSYGIVAWLVFSVIAFCAARFGWWPGIVAGHIVIAVIVLALDIGWIRAEMSAPGWDPATGPDMDIVFSFGVVMRVILINGVLLPLSTLGLWYRSRRLSWASLSSEI